MKNEQAVAIIKDIANKHITPAEQRAIEKAIAALQYCGNLTYYTETKRFGDKPDMREKVNQWEFSTNTVNYSKLADEMQKRANAHLEDSIKQAILGAKRNPVGGR